MTDANYDNVTFTDFNLSRRVVVSESSSPLLKAMPHSPSSSTHREALVNCTNVTTEPIHDLSKPPISPTHGLFKRSRPGDDGGARLKRLKLAAGEPWPCEEDEQGNSTDSEESEEDTDIAYCTASRRRTIFHARHALAMSRPGVTCRPLPCEPTSIVAPSFH